MFGSSEKKTVQQITFSGDLGIPGSGNLGIPGIWESRDLGIWESRDPGIWESMDFGVFRKKSKSSKRVYAVAATAIFSNRFRFCPKLGLWASGNRGIQESGDPGIRNSKNLGIRSWGGPWGRCQDLTFSMFFEKFPNRRKWCLRLQPQPLFRTEFVFVANLIFEALPGHPLYGLQDSHRSPGIQGPESEGGVCRKNPWGWFPGLSF